VRLVQQRVDRVAADQRVQRPAQVAHRLAVVLLGHGVAAGAAPRRASVAGVQPPGRKPPGTVSTTEQRLSKRMPHGTQPYAPSLTLTLKTHAAHRRGASVAGLVGEVHPGKPPRRSSVTFISRVTFHTSISRHNLTLPLCTHAADGSGAPVAGLVGEVHPGEAAAAVDGDVHRARDLPQLDQQADAAADEHDVAGVVVQQVQEDDQLARARESDAASGPPTPGRAAGRAPRRRWAGAAALVASPASPCAGLTVKPIAHSTQSSKVTGKFPKSCLQCIACRTAALPPADKQSATPCASPHTRVRAGLPGRRRGRAWQTQLMRMVRTDRPSTFFLFFQKPMSFLKASMSNTLCSMDTANVTPSSTGLPSSRMRLKSSLSPSAMAPMVFCARGAAQRASGGAAQARPRPPRHWEARTPPLALRPAPKARHFLHCL